MTPERRAELLRIVDKVLRHEGGASHAYEMARALKEMLEADEKTVAIEMLTGAQLREKA